MKKLKDMDIGDTIIITPEDLEGKDFTKEEILNLVFAALPKKEITSQLIRLAVHIIKQQIYSFTTTSWKTSIRDAVAEIKSDNKKSPKGTSVYYSTEELEILLKEKWTKVLAWVASESNGQYTEKQLKKLVRFDKIWDLIEKIL